MVRGYRFDAGLFDRGVFLDGEFGISCAGRVYQLLFDIAVGFDVRVFGGDFDVTVVPLQVLPFICQDRAGYVVYIPVVGEVCGDDVE